MRQAGRGQAEKDQSAQDPGGGEPFECMRRRVDIQHRGLRRRQGAGSFRIPPAAIGLVPGERQQAAPGKKSKQEHGEIKDQRAAVPFHGAEEPADRVALRRGRISLSMDIQHDEVPGQRQEQEQQEAGNGKSMTPKEPPRAGQPQVQPYRQHGNQEADRALRQGRQRHADVEEPQVVAFTAFSVQTQPESVERQGGEEDQHAVGERHPAEADDFQVQ